MTGEREMQDWTDGRPEISVIVAAFRAEATLEGAVRSALDQVGVSVEVVIVDDASPDGTWAVARGLAAADGRVVAIRAPRNLGPAGARNLALDRARGAWVAVLDADDRMVPRRLSRMRALAQERGADVVLGNLCEIDAEGRALRDEPFLEEPEHPAPVTVQGWIAGNTQAVGGRTQGYLKPLFRLAMLRQGGLRYDPALRNGEDFHLVLACLLQGAAVWFSPEADYLYTRRAGSVSDRAAPGDLVALIRADRAVMDRAGLPGGVRALMARRVRGLDDLRTTETVLQMLKAGRIAAARDALRARPGAVWLVLRQMGEGVLRRVRAAV
jgi:succinoglycan biosynthesis protein ExoO